MEKRQKQVEETRKRQDEERRARQNFDMKAEDEYRKVIQEQQPPSYNRRHRHRDREAEKRREREPSIEEPDSETGLNDKEKQAIRVH